MMKVFFKYSDGFITISKSVAEDIIDYIEENNIVFDRQFKIGWFHLGADFTNKDYLDQAISSDIKGIFTNKTFIMVGSIEPRKGHEVVLSAFEKLWSLGYNYNLCILGTIGAMVERFIERIKNHEELNKRLFFIETPPDDELTYCYKNASALIFASRAEGFGLPIIEAAQFNLPLILSDIPVFKEIAGDNAVYFKVFDCDALAEALIKWNRLDEQGEALDSSRIKFHTWEEAFKQITDVVIGENWYKVYD